MRHIGQEAPHLEFRVDARRHLAEDLDDVLVVDNHAAVRLLAIDRMDGLDLGWLPFERRRRPEFDFLVACADRFAGAELGEQDRDELGLGGGIEQRALGRAAANGGQDARRPFVDRGVARPADGQRQEIAAQAVPARANPPSRR